MSGGSYFPAYSLASEKRKKNYFFFIDAVSNPWFSLRMTNTKATTRSGESVLILAVFDGIATVAAGSEIRHIHISNLR